MSCLCNSTGQKLRRFLAVMLLVFGLSSCLIGGSGFMEFKPRAATVSASTASVSTPVLATVAASGGWLHGALMEYVAGTALLELCIVPSGEDPELYCSSVPLGTLPAGVRLVGDGSLSEEFQLRLERRDIHQGVRFTHSAMFTSDILQELVLLTRGLFNSATVWRLVPEEDWIVLTFTAD